ncbi:D-ribose pyranase [Glycomyces arizonensis]|uniref:D-ribose pyranase n=1 Tax=Glycomyces arizonensis TaxID=256035 RepID=UPI0004136A6F|nr:D-ribose pyranase [Glycomyces arizonensis]
MRNGTILHPELARGLASLGHTDVVLVTDAGFPIPADANRIDLALTRGQIDVRVVLQALIDAVFVEEVHFATELKANHPRLYGEVQDRFTGSGAEFHGTTHEALIEEWAPRAKLVVRSGSFEPWANFALVASTAPFDWFTDDDVTILPAYVERRRRITEGERPDLT